MAKKEKEEKKEVQNLQQEIERLHKEAVARGEISYKDPITGYIVFTELFHKTRGICCNSGCRHCPYS